MKKLFISLFVMSGLIFISSTFFSGCIKDDCQLKRTYTKYLPVYKDADAIREVEIRTTAPRELENTGSIYFIDHFVLINEIRKGFHIIDNADPSNPVNLGFLEVEGSQDVAVKDGILYTDNYIDLVAIDVTNPLQPVLKHRTEDVFNSYYLASDKGYEIYYEKTELTTTLSCDDSRINQNFFRDDDGLFLKNDSEFTISSSEVGSGSQISANSQGVGGSLARFTLAKEHLYTLGRFKLTVFDVATADNPVKQTDIGVDWAQMETIFPYEDYLFIGANNGVYIYDNSNPETPVFESKFEHIVSCDPVFVQNDIAYVTLNSNNFCGGSNELEVLDMADMNNPQLIKAYPMRDPHGLSVAENTLYLCDGAGGLKVYDTTDLSDITGHQKDIITSIQPRDAIAIPTKNLLMVICANGFYQYDTSDKSDLTELSVISIKTSN